MAVLDTLPPDQRAALQLLLKQRQTYDQLAGLLSIDAGAVRRRAHAGVEALAGADSGGLSEERRAEIADYLLGQQTGSESDATRDRLAEDESARAWASAVAERLRELAPDAVPEVPAPAREPEPPPEPPPAREPEPPPAPPPEPAPYEEPAPALAEGPATRVREPRPPRERRRPRAPRPRRERRPRAGVGAPQLPSSRLGGALLLAGAAIVVAVVIVLIVNGGGGGNGKSSTLTTNPSTNANPNPNQPVAQINLFSPTGNTSVVGLAQVFRNGQRRAIVIAAQGLSPGTYALWLYNSGTSFRLLGFVPQRVGKNGRFATQGALPGDAASFRRLIVTREQVTSRTRRVPSQPGAIVLQGDLKLG
jgi:hypothetical protein